jgi:hypothetical protein
MIIQYCAKGKAFSDFDDIEQIIKDTYFNGLHLKVSTENVLYVARRMVVENKIYHGDLLFIIEDINGKFIETTIDEYGALDKPCNFLSDKEMDKILMLALEKD